MKLKLLVSIFFFSFFACDKNDNMQPDSVIYESGFSTEPGPIAIAYGEESGFIFIANYNPSVANYSSKIQKFNLEGKLNSTIIDFNSFTDGDYARYIPNDICVNNGNIFVLVRPLQSTDNNWISLEGFCVLQLDFDGEIVKEYNFSDTEDLYYSSIACSDEFIYVTGGFAVIKKIDKKSGNISNIHIPITNDKMYLPVTDMEIVSDEVIYTTGQGNTRIDSINIDVSICHVTKLNCTNEQQIIFYSKSRTGVMAALPNTPGMTIDENGLIYLVTFYGLSLEIYDSDNELILQQDIMPDARPETLPVDIALSDDDIFILDHSSSKVLVYKFHHE